MIRPMTAFIAIALTSGSAIAADPHLQEGHYKLDSGHTYANFTINHMGLSTMHGRMGIESGHVVIDRKGGDSQVDVTFNPASVDTGNKARDEHLRDMKGFFDVKTYPTIKFESTAVDFDRDDPDKASVTGKLTLHGVTRSVTLEVDDIACRLNPLHKNTYTCGFTAETDLKRSDYGMDAFSNLVGDRVELSIEAEADKPLKAS